MASIVPGELRWVEHQAGLGPTPRAISNNPVWFDGVFLALAVIRMPTKHESQMLQVYALVATAVGIGWIYEGEQFEDDPTQNVDFFPEQVLRST